MHYSYFSTRVTVPSARPTVQLGAPGDDFSIGIVGLKNEKHVHSEH
jgi:hypothetical protein